MAADEDGLGLFDIRCGAEASPFKEGDESSVDIYDGLDSGLTVPDNSAPNAVPAGNSLNLFDEILIEEGTAKEASYNELQAEYGKCQQQIKELMKKFKEIQAQNVILQNENQALKKNISALIKTARVEINRKDEEISNLHQRLAEFPNHRTSFTRTYLPGSNGRCSEMCKTKDSKFRPSDLDDSIKMEHRMKNDCSKDTYHSYSSHNMDNEKSSSEKRNTPCLMRYPSEELCNDGTPVCLPNYNHSSNKDNRKERKEMKSNEQYSKGNVDKYKREVHQSTGSKGSCNNGDSEDGNSDPQQKLKTLSEKTSKKELQQKSQSVKLKCSPSAEKRVERGVSSWEKQSTGKDRFQTKGELYADERSQNVFKKDIKTHDKDEKNAGQKSKPNEKLQELPRRPSRGSSPHSKNEHSKSLHEPRKCRMEDSRKGRDIDCKRERGTNDHTSRERRTSPSNSNSREHKYARLKENSSRYEWETAHSKSERHRTEEKRKRERENQHENRHFRSERKVAKEISHQSAKEFKKGIDVTKSERNKSYKLEETSRVANSSKDHKVPKTKDEHTRTKSKDLKLSFMEKLNLTLSPAKKQCLSPTDGLKTPSQKATDEGSTELKLQAERLDSAHPVNCGPTEQPNSTLQVLDSAAQSNVEPALPVCVNSENEALKVVAADPAQSEALPKAAADERSSKTLPEAEAGQLHPQALPGAAEVLVPGEMQAEALSDTAEACDLVESEASATAAAVTDLNHPESLPLEVAGSVAECENLPVTVGVMQDDNVPAAEVAQSEPVTESMGALLESAAEKKEEDKIWLAACIESSGDQRGSQNLVLDDLEAKSSGDLESCDVADDISETKLHCLMEVVKNDDHLAAENVKCPIEEKDVCEINTSTSQSLDRTVLTDKDEPLVDQNACDLEPDLAEISTTASLSGEMCPRTKERETNPVPVDDDCSILSIDLNHLRYIPKAISPLNSPMRPLAKALKMESPCKGHVKSYNKDLIPESTAVVCPSKNLSKEVNKENQKPVTMSDEHLEMESQLSISSDEIEEGEIISSDEDEKKSKPERGSENTKKSRSKASPETRNLTSSPQNQKSRTAHCNEDNGKFVSVKVSTKKNRERHKNQTFRSSKDMKKNKTVSVACLEKIVHVIVEPSNVQEIMQMLRAIRKQMRKNYMKFKVHFPVQHFHRIIESGIINFTSLIKYLNFSKISTLGETLKFSICDIIESKLTQVKKNAIVDRLFEQQVSDMKKQLWKFVDEQLDYLFEKIRRMIIKLCNVGNESEEGKFERAGKQKHKIDHKNDVQRCRKKSLKARPQKPEKYILSKQIVDYQRPKCHREKNKADAPKAAFTKCLNSIDNTRNSQTKVHLSKENHLPGALTSLKGVKYEKEGFQLSRDAASKSDLSYELLTEQQASSLTFNLVSDAQMGEIFKSLLQGSDLLEKNGGNIDRNEWEFRTPEKQFLDSHKCRGNGAGLVEEIAPKEACVESQPVEDITWPVVSPVRAPSLASRLQMSVDPDVLDESCMFEVPANAASCKEDECSLQKNKSVVSSILLEDLAVSLTIPSPLKSDAHLSFLKPENNSSSAPEGVLSAHYSEDALLEEEDATEQDIHLALESDNSSSKSSCSSSWTSRPVATGFQCRPSLPMQAVIMEKSNDHFIVKIRRAVPSTSLASGQVASLKEVRASSTETEKEEKRSGEKEKDSQSVTAATVQGTVTPDLVKMGQLPRVSTGQEQNPALPPPLKESHNSIGKEETSGLLGPCRKSSNTESHVTESPDEGSEQSQAHKLKVSENINEMGVRSQASLPAGCCIESYIDLTDDTVSETSSSAVESTGDDGTQETSTGSSEISDKKEELEECSDAFIDLTEEVSNETVAGECNLETKSTSNSVVGCQISMDDKTSKKRKKEAVGENSNSKRQRRETESASEGSDASDVKSDEVNSAPKQCSRKKNESQQNKDSSPLASSASSPSLYAKNIIKKKGEVVVSWTRNDDREILLECQRKGPSSKTFVSLATRLNKSPNQVSERFKQLMKLFKKSKCK
ncbi:CASP8-associated protein 2 [Nyctibius grandis]